MLRRVVIGALVLVAGFVVLAATVGRKASEEREAERLAAPAKLAAAKVAAAADTQRRAAEAKKRADGVREMEAKYERLHFRHEVAAQYESSLREAGLDVKVGAEGATAEQFVIFWRECSAKSVGAIAEQLAPIIPKLVEAGFERLSCEEREGRRFYVDLPSPADPGTRK